MSNVQHPRSNDQHPASNVQSANSSPQAPVSDLQSQTSAPYYLQNFTSFVLDYVFFGVGMAFMSQTTVLPSFISQLTDSAPLIGLSSTIMSGAWLLPQLVAANYLADKERKKPYLMLSAAIGRPFIWLVALVLFVAGDISPTLILGVLFVSLAIYMGTDSLATVAWFDMLGNIIPATRRGRLYATAQITMGLLTVGAGAVINALLGPQGPPFPQNYALVFFLAGLSLLVSLGALVPLREPIRPTPVRRLPWGEFVPKLLTVLKENRTFNLATFVRLLVGLSGMALPFYVVYATDQLHLGTESVGIFLSSQVIGGILAGFAWGYLNERSGSRIVIQGSTIVAAISPLLALLIGPVARWTGASVTYLYALIFVAIGALNASMMPGFLNYILELAPAEERTTYIALTNTLCSVLLLVPFLGGWIVQVTSYPVLFAATAAGIVLGFLLTFRLEEPRHR